MILRAEQSTLLLIDFQTRLLPAIDGGADVVREAGRLAAAAALLGVPVFATEQTPERMGPTVPDLTGAAAATLSKSSFDATAGCDLLPVLGERPWAILTGCESHICVLQTAFGLLARGRKVAVVTEAVGSRRPSSKTAALARLAQAGAAIVTAEMAIFEWAADANHARFRDVLKLVK